MTSTKEIAEESVDGPFYLETVSVPEESEDEYEYEEVLAEDDSSLAEGEEDLEAALRAMRDWVDDTEWRQLSSAKHVISPVPEVVDDFLRNYLVRMGMVRTLECFETEWYEMLQKGELKTDQVDLVPDACTHNQLLENDLKNVQKERDNFRQAALKAGEIIERLQREKDFHRLQHKRVLQEKNRLIQDIKRLKKHYESYEPALELIKGKYQTALKHKMLVSLERDRAVLQAQSSDTTQRNAHSSPPTRTTTKTTGSSRRDNPRRSPGPPCNLTKDPAKNPASRHPKDSEFPVSRGNPLLPQIKLLSAQSPTSAVYSLRSTLGAHTMPVSCLALHPRQLLLASSSDDQLWRLWGMPEGELVTTGEGHTDWLSCCSFSPSGQTLATTGGDTTVRIWDSAQGRCMLTLGGHTHATWACSFSTCGNFVASCSLDNTAKVWDLQSERCRYTLRGHMDSVNSVAFLPYSNTLLTCSADKTLSLWDARTGLCGQTVYGHQHSCNHAAVSAAGDAIASCDSYGVLKLWDMRKALAMATIDTGPHPGNQVVFSPNGRLLAVASNDGSVKMVELVSLGVSSLQGHGDAVQSVIFDHRGQLLFSGGSDGDVISWCQQTP